MVNEPHIMPTSAPSTQPRLEVEINSTSASTFHTPPPSQTGKLLFMFAARALASQVSHVPRHAFRHSHSTREPRSALEGLISASECTEEQSELCLAYQPRIICVWEWCEIYGTRRRFREAEEYEASRHREGG